MRELLGRLDARELAYWQAYYRLDPWGGLRGDMQAARIAAAVINTMSRGKVDPMDLVPPFGELGCEGAKRGPERPTVEELKRRLMLFTRQAGGKIVKGKTKAGAKGEAKAETPAIMRKEGRHGKHRQAEHQDRR